MYVALPIEFYVVGTPVSVQGKRPAVKREWQEAVAQRARDTAGAEKWNLQETRLTVTLLYFPQASMQGDLDNIITLTIDALVPVIMRDDSLVDCIFAQRFDPLQPYTFREPSDVLLEACNVSDPVLYIRVSEHQRAGFVP